MAPTLIRHILRLIEEAAAMDKLLDSLDQWEDVPEHIKTLLTEARASGSPSANPQVGASVHSYPSSDSESSNYSHDSTSSKDGMKHAVTYIFYNIIYART